MCSVANTRWPVSAAVSAVEIVSWSRISPRRITSGSWRSAPRSVGEGRRVGADLALVDDAVLVLVEELDRVFDRDDVIRPGPVDLVDQRREGRRLARARGAGDETRPPGLLAEAVRATAALRAPRASSARSGSGGTRRRGSRAAIEVHAEAGDAGDRIGHVQLPVQLRLLLLLGRRDPVEEVPRVLGGQHREALHSMEVPCSRSRLDPTVKCRSEALCATICSSRCQSRRRPA